MRTTVTIDDELYARETLTLSEIKSAYRSLDHRHMVASWQGHCAVETTARAGELLNNSTPTLRKR